MWYNWISLNGGDGMSKPMSEQMQKLANRYEKATGKKFCGKTNAQKIRGMSDEELAEFISSIPMCVGKDEDLNCEIDVCKECFLKWLQQPAEEDDEDDHEF